MCWNKSHIRERIVEKKLLCVQRKLKPLARKKSLQTIPVASQALILVNCYYFYFVY